MPAEHPLDTTLLAAAASALDRSSTATLDASHELLAHYSETGDATTQRAVDTLIDHAAEALRALSDSLTDISDELQPAARRAEALEAPPSIHPEDDGSPTRSGRRRER